MKRLDYLEEQAAHLVRAVDACGSLCDALEHMDDRTRAEFLATMESRECGAPVELRWDDAICTFVRREYGIGRSRRSAPTPLDAEARRSGA